MKTVLPRLISYVLIPVLLVMLGTVLAACQCGAPSPTPSPTLQEIDLMPILPDTLPVGSTLQFMATGTYSDNSTADVTGQVTWYSSDTGVVTISSTGLATGVGAGVTVISATLSDVDSQPVELTVEAVMPGPVLVEIDIAPVSPASLAVGSTQQFTATGIYDDGSSADITSQVTWSSSNTSIATILDGGLATGAGAGTTTILASLSGVTSQAVTLTVTGP